MATTYTLCALLGSGLCMALISGCDQEPPEAQLQASSQQVKVGDTIILDASESTFNQISWFKNKLPLEACKEMDICVQTMSEAGDILYSIEVSVVAANALTGITNTLSGSDKDPDAVATASVTVTVSDSVPVTVSGLSGLLTLQNNGADTLTITADGDYTFVTALKEGAAYTVTITTQPIGQYCVVAQGTGIIQANIPPIVVTCYSKQTKVLALSNQVFEIPPNTISFALNVICTYLCGLTNLWEPNGTDLLQTTPMSQKSSYFKAQFGQVGFAVPMHPTHSAQSGTWQFSTIDYKPGGTEYWLTWRTGANLSDPAHLEIKPFVTGAKYSDSQIQASLQALTQLYAKHNIILFVASITRVTDSQFTVVDFDFTNSTTAALIAQGEADKVNIFFVEDLVGTVSGVVSTFIGFGPGTPGAIGIAGSFNGILVGLEEHSENGSLDTASTGATTAHEMGHFLGLFHTTEKTGKEFDPLEDTPECPISNAKKLSSGVQPSDCVGKGGDNLMFWALGAGLDQSTLTPYQLHVLKSTPIAF